MRYALWMNVMSGIGREPAGDFRFAGSSFEDFDARVVANWDTAVVEELLEEVLFVVALVVVEK